jgi:hypothetical protein
VPRDLEKFFKVTVKVTKVKVKIFFIRPRDGPGKWTDRWRMTLRRPQVKVKVAKVKVTPQTAPEACPERLVRSP